MMKNGVWSEALVRVKFDGLRKGHSVMGGCEIESKSARPFQAGDLLQVTPRGIASAIAVSWARIVEGPRLEVGLVNASDRDFDEPFELDFEVVAMGPEPKRAKGFYWIKDSTRAESDDEYWQVGYFDGSRWRLLGIEDRLDETYVQRLGLVVMGNRLLDPDSASEAIGELKELLGRPIDVKIDPDRGMRFYRGGQYWGSIAPNQAQALAETILATWPKAMAAAWTNDREALRPVAEKLVKELMGPMDSDNTLSLTPVQGPYRNVMEMVERTIGVLESIRGGERKSAYFTVEVCDDHDGGSVWIPDEDYLPDRAEAGELAQKVSLRRDNGLARVMAVRTELVTTFSNGREVP